MAFLFWIILGVIIWFCVTVLFPIIFWVGIAIVVVSIAVCVIREVRKPTTDAKTIDIELNKNPR